MPPDPIHAAASSYLYLTHSQIKGAGQGLFVSIPIYKEELGVPKKAKMLILSIG
jgi:hypothetical protein